MKLFRQALVLLSDQFRPNQHRRSISAGLVVSAIALLLPLASKADVNIYSYRQPFLIEPIFDAFTASTGIKVNTVFAKKGLVERLQNEGRNSPADILLTTDSGPLYQAVDRGLTQPVTSQLLQDSIPAEFRDPAGHWFGISSRARIIVASKDRVSASDIKDYEDLAKPDLIANICTRSGKHTYMVARTASMIAHLGYDQASEWMDGVRGNLARKPQGNDRAQVKAIHQGECDVAIINSYYMGQMLADEEQKDWADAVNVIFPNQSNRGTHMNISGVSLTAGAPNREEAIKLIEFMVSDQAQSIYAEANHEYPVKTSTPWSDLVKSWGEFKTDTLPLAEIAKHRSSAVKLADQVSYDR